MNTPKTKGNLRGNETASSLHPARQALLHCRVDEVMTMGALHQTRTFNQSTTDHSLDTQLCNLLQRHLCSLSCRHECSCNSSRLQAGKQFWTRSSSQLMCVYNWLNVLTRYLPRRSPSPCGFHCLDLLWAKGCWSPRVWRTFHQRLHQPLWFRLSQ